MDVGIVILCPEIKKNMLKHTVCSVKYHMYDRECHAIVPKRTSAKNTGLLKEICDVYKAQNTVTSLINTGMRKLKHEWGFLVFCGSSFCPYIEKKLNFATNDHDILYPVYDNNHNFVDGPFNGILINKDFFNKVGEIQDIQTDDFKSAKTFWAYEAVRIGGILKGIAGMRIE